MISCHVINTAQPNVETSSAKSLDNKMAKFSSRDELVEKYKVKISYADAKSTSVFAPPCLLTVDERPKETQSFSVWEKFTETFRSDVMNN